MIVPNENRPPSPYNTVDQDPEVNPPSYQESVPSSQLLPRERPTTSPYAPSISARSDPPREREKELPPNPGFPDEKSKGKEKEIESPAQRAIDVFTSMVWGNAPASPRSPNQASTSHVPAFQDPLNPAPSAFTRPTPKHYAYLPFQPMTMLGIGPKIADGFPMIPPPINSEDETSAGRANTQHPFVSHDVTEEDWLKFLADLRAVVSNPNQPQKSFFARIFQGEPSERDRRKLAVRFIDSWNHYFFQPRRLSVVLSRGRRIFSGASNNRPSRPPGHQRRHSIGDGRGRDANPTRARSLRSRGRSRSTDSSSSSDSSTSSSSAGSTVSEPPEMPVPHTHGSSLRGPFDTKDSKEREAGGDGHGSYSDKGAGWGAPGPSGPTTAPPIPTRRGGLEGKGSGPSREKCTTRREQKQAWRAEKRGMKHERRQTKRVAKYERRAIKRERRHRRREMKAVRRAQGHSRADEPWKLLIFFYGARGDSAGQS